MSNEVAEVQTSSWDLGAWAKRGRIAYFLNNKGGNLSCRLCFRVWEYEVVGRSWFG